jgi:hypothetical protein
MDTDRRDAPSNALAGQASRRAALGRLVGGGGVAALLAAVGLRRHAAAKGYGLPAGLAGSWKSLIIVADRPPLTTLITFISDGTLIQTSSDHPTRSPGHGAWAQTGERDYTFSFERLVFDAAGTFTETQKASARLTLAEDGDAYTGEITSEFFDLAGTLLRAGRPSEMQATRLTV